jgi:hypothetical protein
MLFVQIFLYYYIIKAAPRLTLYRLKDKKGVGRLTSPYRLKNYDNNDTVKTRQNKHQHCGLI